MLEINKIHLGDCLELMQQIPDKSIDLVLTDPPYGTTNIEWDKALNFEQLFQELNRIIKTNNAIVCTGSQPFTTDLIQSNRKYFRYEWIWEKSVGGGFLDTSKKPLKRHENIIVFSKKQAVYNPQMTAGKPYTACRTAGGGYLGEEKSKKHSNIKTISNGDRYPVSVLRYDNETGLHPTQKPVALFEYLIKTYSNPSDLILDPFSGSGTTAVACHNLGRRFICIEKDPDYHKASVQRLKEAQAQLKLIIGG